MGLEKVSILGHVLGIRDRKRGITMQTKGLKGFIKKLRKYRSYLLMLLPAVIYTLVFLIIL